MLPNVPSKEVKQKYYKKVIAKIKQDSNEMTVADLLEFHSQLEEVIMDIKKGVCILDNLDRGCIEVHFYIPTNWVDKAYRNARHNFCQFNKLYLQQLKIGQYPVIYDPFDVIFTSPSKCSVVLNVTLYIYFWYVCTYIALLCEFLLHTYVIVNAYVSKIHAH